MLTIGWFPIFIPLGSADLTKRGKHIVNALGKLVGNIKDRPSDDTSPLHSSQIRVSQILLVNNRTPRPRSSDPNDLSSVCAREQHIPEMGARTADDPRGSNDDAVQDGATDHVTLVGRSPGRERVRCYRGGGVGNDFVTVVAVNPSTRGFDVSELRSVRGPNGFYGLGQRF